LAVVLISNLKRDHEFVIIDTANAKFTKSSHCHEIHYLISEIHYLNSEIRETHSPTTKSTSIYNQN